MEQTARPSKSLIIIMGIMMLVTGSVAIVINLDMVGAIILILVGIISIVGSLKLLFEEKEQQ